jgi:site-specific recombinase
LAISTPRILNPRIICRIFGSDVAHGHAVATGILAPLNHANQFAIIVLPQATTGTV